MANPTQRMPAGPPEWASDASSTVEPSTAEKQAGWQEDQRPPARWQNWYQRTAWQLLDILYETLLKDWRRGQAPAAGNVIRAMGWYNGAFYCEANVQIYRSIDCREWDLVGASPDSILQSINGSASTLVVSSGSVWWSEDDGASWTAGSAPSADAFCYYMPQADLWVGTDALGTIQSADGKTWVITTPVRGGALGDSTRVAENSDGSIVLVDDAFTVDQGVTWALQTNPTAAGAYFYSESLGNFIKVDNSGGDALLRTMSGTAGTWNAGIYATVPDVNGVSLFELRGVLFMVADSTDNPDLGPALLLSRDLGLTWEAAVSTEDWPVGVGVAAEIGIPRSSQFIALYAEGPGVPEGESVLTPPFAGSNFAAPLVP